MPYRLPFKTPLVWRGKTISSRDGLILSVRTTDGRVGYGDVAPLPGFSHETVAEGIDNFFSVDGGEVAVIKPTLCGGIEESWALIQRARQMGMRVILSSSFESGVEIGTLVQLAACCCQHVAVNLDTPRYFCDDVVVDSSFTKGGQLNLHSFSSGGIKLRRDLLEEVLP